MTQERWQQIKQLYHSALECEEDQRAAFLKEACNGDEALQQEVASLLAQEERADGFLDSPAPEVVKILGENRGQSLVGRQIGSYRILSLLGAGGMGEVYKARDTQLDRFVAIKVLPAHLAGRAEMRERFEREARTIANLKHPNICVLYHIVHQEGIEYLVMEYLEGETLDERLKRGPLPMEQVLRYAIEIADALDKVHRQGTTHRDLKPGNIMLTKSGSKLLDFGLAKLREDVAPVPISPSELPAAKAALTARGIILGTLQYMAPEQLEGKHVDARTDIFAFGALVYEMVTAQKAFHGKSQDSLIAAILEHDPPSVTSLQPKTPPALDHLVKQCLAKEPDERWQTASDLMRELKWVAEGGSQTGMTAPAAAPRRIRNRLAWAVAAIAIAVLAAAVPYLRRVPSELRPTRFTIAPPENGSFASAPMFVTVSPDGTRLAFVAADSSGREMLWVRALDSLSAQPLPGTDGAWQPFWSADSHYVAFYAQGKLKKMAVTGGPAQTLLDAKTLNNTRSVVGRSGTWNRDGVILFTPGVSPILRVSSAGGAATPVTTLDPSRQEINHTWPQFLPDGKHFLYLAQSSNPENSAIYVGSLDSKETKRILRADSIAFYSPPGYLLFVHEGSLMAQPFDAGRVELTGEAFPLVEGVQFVRVSGRAAFGVSENGVLAYRVGTTFSAQFAWLDRAGKELGRFGEIGDTIMNFSLSPDEKRLALDMVTAQGRDLWLLDIARGTTSRLASGPVRGEPVWSADGYLLTFSVTRASTPGLYQKLSSGAGQEELLLKGPANVPTDQSRDGRFLLYQRDDPKTGWDLWVLPLFGDRKPEPFLQTEFDESQGQFSPDGRWIAYNSNESGRPEIYVQPFPRAGTKLQISTAGGMRPEWRRDGRELFYLAGRKLMSVEIKADRQFEAGVPRPLFDVLAQSDSPLEVLFDYAVTADGRRFLIIKPKDETAAPITVVLNWTAGLKKQ